MRIVLLRPPRYVWPFNSERSAFWPPLNLLCLAAAVRETFPEARVEIWDAPGMRWGWATVERKLKTEPINVLGVGEEAVSAHEAMKAIRLARQWQPRCLMVAGGVYFSYAADTTLASGNADVIVRGEGERTFVELLGHIDDPGAWANISGLCFRDEAGRIIHTPPRRLVDNLDDLPFPAYELLPLSRYGHGARNHRGLVSIEHSRGCIDNCAFCILWEHMGEPASRADGVRPRYRTKSAQQATGGVDIHAKLLPTTVQVAGEASPFNEKCSIHPHKAGRNPYIYRTLQRSHGYSRLDAIALTVAQTPAAKRKAYMV